MHLVVAMASFWLRIVRISLRLCHGPDWGNNIIPSYSTWNHFVAPWRISPTGASCWFRQCQAFVNRVQPYISYPFVKQFSSWWLNHPFEKYAPPNGFVFPFDGWKFQKYLSCHLILWVKITNHWNHLWPQVLKNGDKLIPPLMTEIHHFHYPVLTNQPSFGWTGLHFFGHQKGGRCAVQLT